jgi:hypothetical protein
VIPWLLIANARSALSLCSHDRSLVSGGWGSVRRALNSEGLVLSGHAFACSKRTKPRLAMQAGGDDLSVQVGQNPFSNQYQHEPSPLTPHPSTLNPQPWRWDRMRILNAKCCTLHPKP